MPFPNIDYQAIAYYHANDDLRSGPRGMITLLNRLGLIHIDEFNAIHNLADLRNDILNRINHYHNNDDLGSIFHRIQIWGGMTGRNIYVKGEGFVQEHVFPHYLQLVNTCLRIVDTSTKSLQLLHDTVCQFKDNVPNVGLSYTTKHLSFWLHRNLNDNALPIYDSILACHIMYKPTVREQDLVPYWNRMILKAQQEGITLDALENLLFNLYRPNNE